MLELLVAPFKTSDVGGREGPIDGPTEGAVDGPIDGPMVGPVDGFCSNGGEGPMGAGTDEEFDNRSEGGGSAGPTIRLFLGLLLRFVEESFSDIRRVVAVGGKEGPIGPIGTVATFRFGRFEGRLLDTLSSVLLSACPPSCSPPSSSFD